MTASPYEPPELSDWPKSLKVGTRIVLSGLSKKLSEMTVAGLKRRVARRFAIIGPKFDFRVLVEGEEISPADRGYQSALEYLWVYGDQAETIALSKSSGAQGGKQNVGSQSRPRRKPASSFPDGSAPWDSRASFKTKKETISIASPFSCAAKWLKRTFWTSSVRKRFMPTTLSANCIATTWTTIRSTTSRPAAANRSRKTTRGIKAVRDLILAELRYIASRWSDWRREDGAKQAANVPEVSSWLEALEGSTKKKAERWVGRLNVIRSETDTDKKELLKASILAFESYRRKEQLEKLEEIGDESLPEILSIFREIDDLELSYYGQIVKLRVGVIKALQDKLKRNDKEAVLRDYIFDHLWLLDTSWERARGSEHVETTVNKFLKDNTKSLPKAEKRNRIDIGYRTASGKHVIIELKRASVAVPLDTLTKQIRKYRDGARRILDKSAYKGWPLEIICLLGKPPPEYETATGPAGVQKSLAAVDARIVFYDELLNNAQQAYADYLEAHVKIDKLWSVFQAIDDFAPPTE